jgi:hypothetical protein
LQERKQFRLQTLSDQKLQEVEMIQLTLDWDQNS